MFSTLKKPYPCIIEDGYKKSMIINIAVGLVVIFILYAFKPQLFFSNQIEYNFKTALIFGVISFTVSFFYTNIVTRFFPSLFTNEVWTVGREIVFLSLIVFTISLVNFFLGRHLFFREPPAFHWIFLLKTIVSTFVVAIVPIIVVVAFYLYFNQKKALAGALIINTRIERHLSENEGSQVLEIQGDGKYELLQIPSTNLLFVESTGNYCDLFYLNNGSVSKATFRVSLSSVEQQLDPFTYFFKSHRSFLVNIHMIKETSGNAQGYHLTLNYFNDRTIPVSRSKIPTFDALFT